MKIYTRTDTVGISNVDFGSFDVGPDGSYDVPDELGRQLLELGTLWESETEHANRLATEDAERRRDPVTLLAAIDNMRREIESLRRDLAATRSGRRS